jgi:hypothetical protein
VITSTCVLVIKLVLGLLLGLHGKLAPRKAAVTGGIQINEALADPKLKARLSDLGGVMLPHTPAEFGKRVAEDTEKWAKVIWTANIKAE